MIPVVQLDPASLTVWFDSELINRTPAEIPVSKAVVDALWGDVDDVHELVDEATSAIGRTRAVHLASAVWHEQRHFVDLLLTNHGAFRVRRFLMSYVNLGRVLDIARQQGGSIWCPLTVYNDQVERDVLGIEGDSEDLRTLARDFAVRTQMTAEDRMALPLAAGPMEIGGDAQLEALAWFCQHSAVALEFGLEANRALHEDLGEAQRNNLLYSWGAHLVDDFGLGRSQLIDERNRIVDISLLCPILYGSLASRRWGQEQIETEYHASGFPAARLSGLIRALRGKGHVVDGDTATGWRLVNEAAADLWGRSVIEEVRKDLAYEAEFLQTIDTPDTSDAAQLVVADYHRLRSRLVDALEHDPVQFLDPFVYARAFLRTVRPLPVFAMPTGVLGEPEPSLERLVGYSDPDTDTPESKWWWAATPRDWPWGDDDLVVLGERGAWIATVERLAPTTKILLHGFRHRVMLGPELISAERRLSSEGYQVHVHGAFTAPDDLERGDFYFDLTGLGEAVCDICRTPLRRESAYALSPWAFRRNTKRAALAEAILGGGDKGRLRFIRDWSVWLVCATCRAGVQNTDLGALVERMRASAEGEILH